MTLLTSHADVTTDAAARYAKQLAAHLGRRAEVVPEAEGDRIVIGDGSCLLVPGEAALVLRAQAPSQESLARVQDVVGGHLERFGQRNELAVHWHPG
jgi:uncharacterized protein